jgi:hypothetical protein
VSVVALRRDQEVVRLDGNANALWRISSAVTVSHVFSPSIFVCASFPVDEVADPCRTCTQNHLADDTFIANPGFRRKVL